MTNSVLTLALFGAIATVDASHNSKAKTYTYTSTYNYNYSGYTGYSGYAGYASSYIAPTYTYGSYTPSSTYSYSGGTSGGSSYGGYSSSYGGYSGSSYRPTSYSGNSTGSSYNGTQKLDYSKPAAEYKINVGQGEQTIVYKAAEPVQLSNGSILEGVRVKFMDYFFYALVGGSDVVVSDVGKCIDECGKGEWV
jgi:hypothetical protein